MASEARAHHQPAELDVQAELTFLDQLAATKPDASTDHASISNDRSVTAPGCTEDSIGKDARPAQLLDSAAELAFLDQLAGAHKSAAAPIGGFRGTAHTDCTREAAADSAPAPACSPPHEHVRKEYKAQFNMDASDELAFLDALAGVAGSASCSKNVAELSATKGEAAAAQPGAGAAESATPLHACGIDPPAAAASANETPCEARAKVKTEAEAEEETYERDATELLGAFTKEEKETEVDALDAQALLKQFMMDMREVDRENEVTRVLWAFKLNPFEKLGLRFTATATDVRSAYRKISLLIHPDRCKHPQAADAFEVLGAAQEELMDEEARSQLMRVLEYARDAVREERRKATKHDTAVRIAASLHADGRDGVEAAWEETDDFHEKWKAKSRDVLARAEFRRRKLNKRLREEEARIETQEKEKAQKRKEAHQDRKEWLDKRGSRLASWKDFTKKHTSTERVQGKKQGGTKAPTIKTFDAERSYVQRPTTEQFVGNYKKRAPK